MDFQQIRDFVNPAVAQATGIEAVENLSMPVPVAYVPVQLVIDGALSLTSENPVQNKVIAVAIQQLDGRITAIEGQFSEGVTEAVNNWLAAHPEATTTVQDGAITYAKLDANLKGEVDQISELKSAISTDIITALNGWVNGYIRNGDGTIGSETHYVVSPFFNVDVAQSVLLTIASGYKVKMAIYNSEGVYQVQVVEYAAGTHQIEMPVDKSYRFQFGAVATTVINPSDVNTSIFSLSYTSYTDKTLSLSGKSADAKVTGEKIASNAENISKIVAEFVPLNTFNKANITENTYIDTSTGATVPLNNFFSSDYCDIHVLDQIGLAGTHLIAFYDADRNFILGRSDLDSRYNSKSVERPSNAYYLRFSTGNSFLDSAQVGYRATLSDYHEYGTFLMPNLITGTGGLNEIIVAADGSGDYTSFTQAIYEHVNDGITVIVKPGTYDIRAEYVALFGADVVASLADSTDLNGFQYGIALRRRKVFFETSAKLVCDWTGITVDGSHRFSPIRVDYDVEIDGMNLECQRTFYAIHDDYGLLETPYTVKYRNCVVNAENLIQQNVIGGGCKKYSRHIIENCYFNNGTNSNIHTARYHNTNQAGAVPEIYISNTYFNGTFTARWYGTQTTKMRVYVNNCKARAIYTMQEATGYDAQNVDLYKWCCEETNPVQ